MPGTFFHDFTGIACLVIYVIAPLLVLLPLFLKRFGSVEETAGPSLHASPLAFKLPALHSLILLGIICSSFRVVNADALVTGSTNAHLPGFHCQQLQGGIVKFENKDALIYLKPTPFYIPEHDPVGCWTGSGYRFTSIRPETVAGQEMYTAVLEKGKNRLYAAWWFDNGRMQTVNQFAWRWSAAKGMPPFYLINVNAASRAVLQTQISRLLAPNSHSDMFK